jgi:hypothetical protein
MSQSKKGTFWVVIAFGLPFGFIVFILGMVLYASIQDIQLVEESYYEKGLVYQDRIDRMMHTRELDNGLDIEHRPAERAIVLTGPTGLSGVARLVRPSNSRYDRTLTIEFDSSGEQFISTDDMVRGLWRLEVDWSLDSVGYYTEARIVLP